MKIELDTSSFITVEQLWDMKKNAPYYEVNLLGITVARVDEDPDGWRQVTECSVRVQAEEQLERAVRKLWAMGEEEA